MTRFTDKQRKELLRPKAQERAEQKAMEYICRGTDEGVYKDNMPDWAQDHWHDFLTEAEMRLFE